MRIIIAPDKYKGSLSAIQVAEAMERGAKSADPGCETVLCPMADGGEGTVEVISRSAGAQLRMAKVRGPLPGQEVEASWAYMPSGPEVFGPEGFITGFLERGQPTAVIEMAQASGYELVDDKSRNPMITTTYGTGQLVREALDAGCLQVIVGIGGSGTVDGGTGMATALGFKFLDTEGRELPLGGGWLGKIESIDGTGRDERLKITRFLVASDVDNPLTGQNGAARVFGPQKGATPEQVEELEAGLENLAHVLSVKGMDVTSVPGAGAAGGLGAGLVAFCGASIVSGVELIAGIVGLPEKVRGSDLVLTGEGSYDSQTARGKTPAGVAKIAREAGVMVALLAGSVGGPETEVPAFSVIDRPMTLEEAILRAPELVETCTDSLVRVISRAVRANPSSG